MKAETATSSNEFVVEQVSEQEFEQALFTVNRGRGMLRDSKYSKIFNLVMEKKKPYSVLCDNKKGADSTCNGLKARIKVRNLPLVVFMRGTQVWIAPKSLYDSIKTKVEMS